MTATRTYDAFGNVVASTGSQVGPFGYGGKFGYQEDSVGYKLLGDRWYDPEAGRFLTRDRAHDGRNWYVYCENMPLKRFDSTGQEGDEVQGTLEGAGMKDLADKFDALDPAKRRAIHDGGLKKLPGQIKLPADEVAEAVEDEIRYGSPGRHRPRKGRGRNMDPGVHHPSMGDVITPFDPRLDLDPVHRQPADPGDWRNNCLIPPSRWPERDNSWPSGLDWVRIFVPEFEFASRAARVWRGASGLRVAHGY